MVYRPQFPVSKRSVNAIALQQVFEKANTSGWLNFELVGGEKNHELSVEHVDLARRRIKLMPFEPLTSHLYDLSPHCKISLCLLRGLSSPCSRIQIIPVK